MSKTLYDKLWDQHIVRRSESGETLLYIDRHLIHEVTSPQAFAGLKLAGRDLWRKDVIVAVPDHNVPTTNRSHIDDVFSKLQVDTLEQNCAKHGIRYYSISDIRQGIVHVIGPEQGLSLPGMTIVCGDSHTSTHGAFAALAMGIGTSEVEHVMATQCLSARKMKNMRILVEGDLPFGVTAKDLILAIIRKIGVKGGVGHAIEYAGSTIRQLTMEQRMTVCNMSIEAGARAGMIAFDQTTLDYLMDKHSLGQALFDQAVTAWWELKSDEEATFDAEISFDAQQIAPQVTWGTSPDMVVSVDQTIPDPEQERDAVKAEGMSKALQYMGLKAGTAMTDIEVDKIFIGSCTNGRIEDLREVAKLVEGKKIASNIKQAIIVPGSGLVKQQAEAEQLDHIFTAAGFEWRESGCSMCLGMNADRLQAEERCASTSNRNFEGRQGQGGRTHLVSPAMAAATAIHGHFVDVREIS